MNEKSKLINKYECFLAHTERMLDKYKTHNNAFFRGSLHGQYQLLRQIVSDLKKCEIEQG